ncbi:hypothetical protein EON66_08165, partial [archaeon]
ASEAWEDAKVAAAVELQQALTQKSFVHGQHRLLVDVLVQAPVIVVIAHAAQRQCDGLIVQLGDLHVSSVTVSASTCADAAEYDTFSVRHTGMRVELATVRPCPIALLSAYGALRASSILAPLEWSAMVSQLTSATPETKLPALQTNFHVRCVALDVSDAIVQRACELLASHMAGEPAQGVGVAARQNADNTTSALPHAGDAPACTIPSREAQAEANAGCMVVRGTVDAVMLTVRSTLVQAAVLPESLQAFKAARPIMSLRLSHMELEYAACGASFSACVQLRGLHAVDWLRAQQSGYLTLGNGNAHLLFDAGSELQPAEHRALHPLPFCHMVCTQPMPKNDNFLVLRVAAQLPAETAGKADLVVELAVGTLALIVNRYSIGCLLNTADAISAATTTLSGTNGTRDEVHPVAAPRPIITPQHVGYMGSSMYGMVRAVQDGRSPRTVLPASLVALAPRPSMRVSCMLASLQVVMNGDVCRFAQPSQFDATLRAIQCLESDASVSLVQPATHATMATAVEANGQCNMQTYESAGAVAQAWATALAATDFGFGACKMSSERGACGKTAYVY